MLPGVGIYIFDNKFNLLLVQKPDSKFGKNPKTGEIYWLVPGTTTALDELRSATIEQKEDIAKKKCLKKDIIFPEGYLGGCHYAGRWLYDPTEDGTGDPYFFDNFVVNTHFLSEKPLKSLENNTTKKKDNGISKIGFFHLLDLPAEGKLSPLTAGFLKSLLFQNFGEITTDITIEQKREFADIVKEQKNRFFLYQKVKEGTYGDVYKVLDIPTLLPKAIKTAIPATTDKKWRERFILEGTTLMRLRQLSPELDNSIERIFSINQIDDNNEKYFLVKNWVSGKTLQEEFNGDGRNFLFDKLIIDIMKEIIRALKALHSLEKPIYHRDLKPNNVMVSFDNKKKQIKKLILIDFGLCKNKEVHIGTYDDFDVGNRIYQSVHTVNHYSKHNAIDDDYSSLQIFYWLLFGTHPYATEWEEILKDKRRGVDTFLLAKKSTFKAEGWPKSSKLFQLFFGIIQKHYSDKPTLYNKPTVQKKTMKEIHKLFDGRF